MTCCHSKPATMTHQLVVVAISIGAFAALAYSINNYRKWKSGKSRRHAKPFLTNKHESKTVTLISKESVTHDVRLFRFQLPNSDNTLGILAGEHIKLTADIASRTMFRFYSPISKPEEKGYFEIIMKIYSPNSENPNQGTFSRYMDSLPLDSDITISGPFGRFGYLSNGDFLVNAKAVMKYKSIAMISGGSGLTPMLPIIREVIKENHINGPKLSLIYTNKTEDDVIQSDELKRYAHTHDSFNLTLVFTRLMKKESDRQDPVKWIEKFERIDESLFSNTFPKPQENVLVLICGPKGMNEAAKLICTSLGYPNIHVF
uniref:NADH-cytochrome b5 reductase n=1 Tax=Panagrolaimus davidi TaxID=227884 RepID=A0A914QY54_9BILA